MSATPSPPPPLAPVAPSPETEHNSTPLSSPVGGTPQ